MDDVKGLRSLDALMAAFDEVTDSVEIGTAKGDKPAPKLDLRPLTLTEMVRLLGLNQKVFIALYGVLNSPDGKINLAPILLAAPEMMALIIAIASDQEDEIEAAKLFEKKLSVTVQLIAVEKVWRMSVPDPKKLYDLLSEVMGLLRELKDKQGDKAVSKPSLVQSSGQ